MLRGQVSRHFTSLVRGSPILQYRCELFSAGLIDNSHHPYDLVERRKQCKEYVDKWTRTANVVKKVVRSVHWVPVERPTLAWNYSTVLGVDLLTFYHSSQPGRAKFIRVPPAANQPSVEGWIIPQIPFEVLHFAVYAPENLLAVVERRGQ